ncbi:VOC family protein [Devosia submarina]|uniref:VOC family protein n=1 Tax=Devosia submarina TaxID=1173082 RepID=UPI000D391E13|nr:VOC family protein [Devosia submarina]
MPRSIATVTLLVADYDEAIAFYCNTLGFALIADDDLGGGKRWVVVSPQGGARLLLARADGPEQRAAIGNQAAGRVMLFLETDDFMGDYSAMLATGIAFAEEPRHESYGTVAVFKDLYGNLWDVIEPRS